MSGALPPIDYGVLCSGADERALIKHVNSFLAKREYRKMYKWPDRSIQPPERTFRIAHYYCQFMKQPPRWYFDLRPNADLDGRLRHPDHPDCGWILYTRSTHPEQNSVEEVRSIGTFFADLVANLGFSTIVIHTYSPEEDRL